MTRINSAIPVQNLTDEHLLAEHREIKRLPDNFLKALKSGALRRIPKEFCLGTGHVTFFLDKQQFLMKRYGQIHAECLKRGFNVEDYSKNWYVLADSMAYYNCCNDYLPTAAEKHLLRTRIYERITTSKKERFHYYGKPISKNVACALIWAANNGISYKKEFEKWQTGPLKRIYDSSDQVTADKAVSSRFNDTILRKGDKVLFTNDYGVTFGPHEVLGFREPTTGGHCVYFDHDAYWFPAKLNQIIKL